MDINKNKIKILFIEYNRDGTVGGSHFSLLNLIRGLDRSRFEPIVIFYQQHRLFSEYESAGAKVILFQKKDTVDYVGSFQTGVMKAGFGKFILSPVVFLQKALNFFIDFALPIPRCYRILVKESISIVHLNNTLMRPQEWIAASVLSGRRIVAHERGINSSFPLSTKFWARYLSKIICISDAVWRNLRSKGFLEKQLLRIYNGIDPEKFVPSNPEKIIKEYKLSGKNRIIGIIGNLKHWKGQHVVINALVRVKKEFKDVKCLLVGGWSPSDKKYYTELTCLVESLGLEQNVVFTGSRTDVPDLIANMEVLIHSSVLPEPFGRVLLEGMALSRPVITTSIGAGPEIVVDGETGLIVPPDDPDALAAAIIYILKNKDLATRMGTSGRKRLEGSFHIKRNVERTTKLYESILP